MTRAARILLASAALTLLMPAIASAKGAPSIAFVPGPTFDYGTVGYGAESSQAFVLTNSGGVATAALSIGRTGPSSYSITADGCSATSLGPKKFCTITVRYSPGIDSEISDVERMTLSASSRKPSAAATVALSATVGPAVNRAPVATNDTFNHTEDVGSDLSLGNVMVNDSDADGDPLILWACTGGSADTAGVADPATALPGLSVQRTGCILTIGTDLGVSNITIDTSGTSMVTIGFPFALLSTGDSLTLTMDYTITDPYGNQDSATMDVVLSGITPG